MAKKKSGKRQPRTTDSQLYDFVQHCSRLIKTRIAAGAYSDRPELERALANFDPALSLIEIAADQNNTPELRGAVASKLMPFWHKEQSLLLKDGAEGQARGVNVQVVIASWAAKGGSGAPALEPPKPERAVEIDYTSTRNDPELANVSRSSRPAPNPAEDPTQKVVAFTKWGAPVTAKRLADLKAMGEDTSSFVYAPLAAGSGNYEVQRSADRVERVVAVESADRDRERYRAMCREAGKLSQPGEEGYTTNFKLFE